MAVGGRSGPIRMDESKRERRCLSTVAGEGHGGWAEAIGECRGPRLHARLLSSDAMRRRKAARVELRERMEGRLKVSQPHRSLPHAQRIQMAAEFR